MYNIKIALGKSNVFGITSTTPTAAIAAAQILPAPSFPGPSFPGPSFPSPSFLGQAFAGPAITAPKAMLSPCIGVCELDTQDMCTGCHRTANEIGAWTSMTDDQRSYVMEVLLEKRSASV